MAEEAIHGARAGEVLDPSEKFGGDGFGIGSHDTDSGAACVIGAERRLRISICGSVVRVEEHVATAAFGTDVFAVESSFGFRRHGEAFRLKSLNV